jgi:hypothetical protein
MGRLPQISLPVGEVDGAPMAFYCFKGSAMILDF